MIRITQPTVARLEGYDDKHAQIKSFLTYKDKNAEEEFQRFKRAQWFYNKYGPEAYKDRLRELRESVQVCLLFEDRDGLWTYSGIAQQIADKFGDQVVNEVQYPERGLIPWAKVPEFEDRYYQKATIEKMLEARHSAVELATGLGKTACFIKICKELGLPAVIMAPSISIAEQTYKQFVKYFGKKHVGMYGDGKKEFDKMFTIGIAASLTKIKKDSPAYNKLSQAQVFTADESHLVAAETLANVCFGICAKAPYRFFFSGTQLRTDGSSMLLSAITGPIVYKMSVKQGVDEGFLAKPNFIMVRHKSPLTYVSDDYKAMVDAHMYKNPALAKQAAEIANKSVTVLGHQVLILLEHVEQLKYLLPYLTVPVEFAHGGVTADNKDFVPKQFHKSDPNKLVNAFNEGKIPLLVGTSCISIGTDIRPCKTIINLQGGTSEVKIRQAVGRGTRRTPDKDSFNYIDFFIEIPNAIQKPSVVRHCEIRAGIYDDIYGPITILDGF